VANSDELVQKREALLDAAAFEFDRHGFDGTRIQDFLERASVTKGGMYHHFATKRDVGQAIVDHGLDRWRRMLEDSTHQEERGLAGLTQLMRAVADVLHTDIRVRAAVKVAVELDLPGSNPFELWQDAVSLRLQQAIADGSVPDSLNLREVSADLVDIAYGICTTPAPWGKSADVKARIARVMKAEFPAPRRV
jgi:AcrR family transcriptional regulator